MFEQDRVIVRLQQRVMREPQVLVCFLAGSYGRRTQDAYSDLDVALVFGSSTEREASFSQRVAFVQSVLPYVPAKSFDADHIRPYFHIVLYGNGTKADFRYETQEELQPNPWDRELRILKDHAGWGEQYQAACAQLAFPSPTISAGELEALDNRFWVMFWDSYRQILRGNYDKPFGVYLQLFEFTFKRLIELLPAEDPARAPLFVLHYHPQSQTTLPHLQQLLQAYRQAREAVVRRYKLMFMPNVAFERELLRQIKPN